MSKSKLIEYAFDGAIAGLAATGPMSAVMETAAKYLPKRERYPLPPRIITRNVTRKAGFEPPANTTAETALTMAAHFSYGAGVGALYGLLIGRNAGPFSGAAYGLAVWTTSYLGVLPALKLLSSATEHPPRRNALMIGAHLVWGAALGAACRRARSDDDENSE